MPVGFQIFSTAQDILSGPEIEFFATYLRLGMSVLDCGCGDGRITLELVELLGDGNVTGIDRDDSAIAAARASITREASSRIRFETADIYHLPFADASFDAVYVNAVFVELREPVRAARELHRVLKPGGVCGLRDTDVDGGIIGNSTPDIAASIGLHVQWQTFAGFDLHVGRELGALLSVVGFDSVAMSASYVSFGTPELVAAWGRRMAQNFRRPELADVADAQGWASSSDLERYSLAWLAWSEQHPSSFFALPWCQAVGWKAG
jgi:SAM-dependent methyltransferase